MPPHTEILYEIIRTRIECQYEVEIDRPDSRSSGRAAVRLIIKPALVQKSYLEQMYRGGALKGLEKIYKAGYRYKKAGVMLNHLVPAEELSMRLYGDEGFEPSRRIMKAMDEINRLYGREIPSGLG